MRRFGMARCLVGSEMCIRDSGANRLAEGKLPLCAEMCSTKSLLAGDGEIIAQIYKAVSYTHLTLPTNSRV